MAEDRVPQGERKQQGLCPLGRGMPRSMVPMEGTQNCLRGGTVRVVSLQRNEGCQGPHAWALFPKDCIPMSWGTLKAVPPVTWGA